MQNNYDFLKNSLIFQMSLGSKELFHSNVWAWLIEQDYEYIKVFFNDVDLTQYEFFMVEREKSNRDIIIWLKEKENKKEKTHYLVIENKIKSIPTSEQLKKYSTDLDKCKIQGAVITGLEDNLDEKTFNNITWVFMSYKDIADSIENITNNSKKETIIEKKEQIKEYCNVIRAINTIISEKLEKLGNSLLCDQWNVEKYGTLNKLRIDDLLKKANGAKFIKYLRKHAYELEKDLPDKYKLIINQRFNNNKVTIDIFYTNDEELKEENDFFFIGIQLEGKQYRRVVCRNKFNTNFNFNSLFEEMAEKEWFDKSYSLDNKIIFEHKSTMSKLYNSYKPNIFVYQHYEINEDNALFEKLFDNIKKDMEKAKIILKQI